MQRGGTGSRCRGAARAGGRAVVFTLAVALLGCGEAEAPTSALELDAAYASAGFGSATYRVTIMNLTDNQPFTPPLAATHRAATRLFDVGKPASGQLQQIAENGNLDPMLMALGSDRHVFDVVVAVAGDPPPLMAGASITFEIEASAGTRFFSFVSMLICTNDGFTGVNALKLPERVGQSTTVQSDAYDAGTEINTEDFSDLVPPCPVLTGVMTAEMGTGMTNPALAEHGVVHHHPGIQGIEDLIPEVHDWLKPVATITIERTG